MSTEENTKPNREATIGHLAVIFAMQHDISFRKAYGRTVSIIDAIIKQVDWLIGQGEKPDSALIAVASKILEANFGAISPKLVIAGSHQEYRDWLARHNYSPSKYRYLSEPIEAMGYKMGTELLCVGQWWESRVVQSPDVMARFDLRAVT